MIKYTCTLRRECVCSRCGKRKVQEYECHDISDVSNISSMAGICWSFGSLTEGEDFHENCDTFNGRKIVTCDECHEELIRLLAFDVDKLNKEE